MIELLMKPKKAERNPWEMFFVGLFWASVAFLLVNFVFMKDSILGKYAGLLVVIFTVIVCLPFMYYIIKLEEGKDVEINDSGKLIKEHSKAIRALMWLFLGFVVAFSFWYIVMPNDAGQIFNAQIETFCAINSPSHYNDCLGEHGVSPMTGAVTGTAAVLAIFAKGELAGLGLGLLRYMIHGVPEISAYFVGALAGGIISVAVIRKDLHGEGTWKILQDSLLMVIIAIVILVIAALMEVYLTPLLF